MHRTWQAIVVTVLAILFGLTLCVLVVLQSLGFSHGLDVLSAFLVAEGTAVAWAFGHVTQQGTVISLTNGFSDVLNRLQTATRAPSRADDPHTQAPPGGQ